ncbi:hypothetical protein [Vibrio sp. E150_018]
MKNAQIYNVFTCFFILFSISYHSYLYSSEINIDIKGDRIDNSSLENKANGQVPLYWDIPINLPSAEYVIPGGIVNNDIVELSLTNKSTRVIVPISIQGMMYRLANYVDSSDESTGTAITSVYGKDILVTGKGNGSHVFRLNKLSNPITHYKVYFSKIDGKVWYDSFNKSHAKSGVYNGNINVTATYDYIINGVRVRQLLPININFTVDYTPQYINLVDVNGQDSMDIKYHFPLKVSGETTYMITATGFFPNGLWLGLLPPNNEYFSLISNKGDKKEIKYDATCTSGCVGNNKIIVDGEPIINTTTKRIVIDSENQIRAMAKIKVSFEPVSEEYFKGSTYTGQFTLLFEARI